MIVYFDIYEHSFGFEFFLQWSKEMALEFRNGVMPMGCGLDKFHVVITIITFGNGILSWLIQKSSKILRIFIMFSKLGIFLSGIWNLFLAAFMNFGIFGDAQKKYISSISKWSFIHLKTWWSRISLFDLYCVGIICLISNLSRNYF